MPEVSSRTAPKSMRTVSTPSRKIIRNTNRKTPERLPLSARVLLQTSFNFAFQLAAMAVHPDDHAEDENGADEQHPALVGVLVQVDFRKAPCRQKASNNGTYERPVDGRHQIQPAGFPEVGDGDGDHQRGLDSLAQSDHESLQHNGNSVAIRLYQGL